MIRQKGHIIGAAGALLVHAVLFLFLYLVLIRQPELQEEGGLPVILGNENISQNLFDPATMTEVDILSETESSQAEQSEVVQETEQEIITQQEEPTVALPEHKKKKIREKKKEELKNKVPSKEVTKREPVRPKEKTEAEKKAEVERAAAERVKQQMSGAFGKGSGVGSTGSTSSGSGTEGSLQGNSATGKSSGTGGYGTFDLNGRSLGEGGLPKPVYRVQDEGRVVVTITVNPAGRIIATSINKRTNTVNVSLRRAAEEAARRARFNSVSGVNNQTGTITYYFKLK